MSWPPHSALLSPYACRKGQATDLGMARWPYHHLRGWGRPAREPAPAPKAHLLLSANHDARQRKLPLGGAAPLAVPPGKCDAGRGLKDRDRKWPPGRRPWSHASWQPRMLTVTHLSRPSLAPLPAPSPHTIFPSPPLSVKFSLILGFVLSDFCEGVCILCLFFVCSEKLAMFWCERFILNHLT